MDTFEIPQSFSGVRGFFCCDILIEKGMPVSEIADALEETEEVACGMIDRLK